MAEVKFTPTQNPTHVEVKGREYAVFFNDAGGVQTVMVHKKYHQTARLNINGPTARAAIAALAEGKKE